MEQNSKFPGESLNFSHEEEARPCVELLLNIVEGSSQPFVIADAVGLIKGCNSAFCRLTGYTREELRTKKCGEDLTPGEWRRQEAGIIAGQIKSKMPAIYSKEYVRKDGVRIPIELYNHIIYDKNGRPLYFYAFVTNIRKHVCQP